MCVPDAPTGRPSDSPSSDRAQDLEYGETHNWKSIVLSLLVISFVIAGIVTAIYLLGYVPRRWTDTRCKFLIRIVLAYSSSASLRVKQIGNCANDRISFRYMLNPFGRGPHISQKPLILSRSPVVVVVVP